MEKLQKTVQNAQKDLEKYKDRSVTTTRDSVNIGNDETKNKKIRKGKCEEKALYERFIRMTKEENHENTEIWLKKRTEKQNRF